MLLGLLTVWYADFFGAQTQAVLPYDQYLKRFPAYLQQLTMESNGKHVTLAGEQRRLRHRPGLLGRAGHERPAQLLPADPPGHRADPVPTSSASPTRSTRSASTTTCSRRTSSRRPRRSRSARRPSRSRPRARRTGSCRTGCSTGNRPSNTLLLERLTPYALGTLVALYEHSVFVQGTVWSINSFDQWGVELGKVLAKKVAGRTADRRRARPHARQLDQRPDPPLPRSRSIRSH